MTLEGILHGLDFEKYLAAEGVSASTLSGYARSAMHGRYWEQNPSPSTKTQKFGTMIHAMLLEPEKFAAEYVLLPDSPRRGSESWKDWERLHPGKTLIKQTEDGENMGLLLSTIQQKWNDNNDVRKLMDGALCETSLFWIDHEYRERCKARPDIWNPKLRVMCDLKTTSNAAPWQFGKQVTDLGYYRKAAWYQDAMAAVGEKVEEFVFIAVETELPCAVSCYVIDAASLELGRKENRDLLKVYHTCKILGEWPGYPSLTDIGIAPWAKKQLEEKYGKSSGGVAA